MVHDSVLLGYDVASVGNQFTTFRRTVFKNQTPRPLRTMMASWSNRLLVSNVRLTRWSHVQFAVFDSVRMKLSLQYRDRVVSVVFESTDMARAVL